MAVITQLAEIIGVNVENYTCTVRTISEEVISDVCYSNLYLHQDEGATLTFVPEVGAQVWVLIDGPHATILTYMNPVSFDEGYRSGRPKDVEEGDCIIKTTGGSLILVKKNGDVLISCGEGAAFRQYAGRGTNAIIDTCENYVLNTAGGAISWEKNPISPLPQYTLNLIAHQSSIQAEAGQEFILKIGANADSSDSSVILKISVPNEIVPVFKYIIDILGNSIETSLKKVIEAKLAIILKGSLPTTQILLGGEEATERVIKGDSFIDLFLTHTHTGEGSGPPTTVPLEAYSTLSNQVKVL